MSTVKIPPVLRASVGGAKEVEASGASVGDVLRSLAEQHPATESQLFSEEGDLNRYVNVYLNDEDVRVLDGLDTERVRERHDRDPAGHGRRLALIVRHATAADVEHWGRLWASSARAAFAPLLPEGHPLPQPNPEGVRARLASSEVSLLVADDDGALAGFTGCGISRDADAGPEVGEIWSFFVASDRWRAGVGRALMGGALDDLRLRGYAEATVWSFDSQRARQRVLRGAWLRARRRDAHRGGLGAPAGGALPARAGVACAACASTTSSAWSRSSPSTAPRSARWPARRAATP